MLLRNLKYKISQSGIAGILLLLFLTIYGCSSFSRKNGNDEVVFKVSDMLLTQGDLNTLLKGQRISPDSTYDVYRYLRSVAIDQLLLQRAEDNIRDRDYVDSLVAGFRNSLIVSLYEEQMLRERLSSELTPEQIRNYYTKNAASFILKQNLIKGVFLKVPVDAPDITRLKEWVKKISPDDLEKIEKYSILNAQIYNCFLDNWVDFSSILRAMPAVAAQLPAVALKESNLIAVSDERFVYLLGIKEYKLAGEQEPFEWAGNRIEEMMLNEKKNRFLSDFRSEMFEKALETGKVIYRLKQ